MSVPVHRRRGRGGQGGHEPRARIRMREQRATELSILGWSQHQIAADLGVSQAAVSKMLKRVDGRALRELTAAVERQKVRHTQRLEHLFREALQAWEQSKSDMTRRRQRKIQGSPGSAGGSVAEIVVENQHGDPRYLEEARKALADHRKLWGLDAPQKLEVRPVRNVYEGMSEDALREAVDRQSRLLNPADSTILAPIETDRGSAAPGTPSLSPPEDPNHVDSI